MDYCKQSLKLQTLFTKQTMAARKEVMELYKSLIREGSKFSNYNFRMYTLRKVHDAFKSNKDVTDVKKIEELFSTGKENLAMLRRQVVVDHLYRNETLVIDKHSPKQVSH